MRTKIAVNLTAGDLEEVALTPEEESAADAAFAAEEAEKNSPERRRLNAIDASIADDNVIAQIKAMTPAEYDAWWSTNVTNAAQAIGVLKRVVRVVCRRVL